MSATRFGNNLQAQGLILDTVNTDILKIAASIVKLGLAAADFDDTDANLKFSDITDASFVGYTAGGVVIPSWLGPLVDPPTKRAYLTPSAQQIFTAGAIVGPQTIYGWWLTDGGINLLAAGKFDVPVIVDTTGDTITILPLLFFSGPDGPDAKED